MTMSRTLIVYSPSFRWDFIILAMSSVVAGGEKALAGQKGATGGAIKNYARCRENHRENRRSKPATILSEEEKEREHERENIASGNRVTMYRTKPKRDNPHGRLSLTGDFENVF